MVALLILVLHDIVGGGFSYGQAHSLPGNPMAFHRMQGTPKYYINYSNLQDSIYKT